MHELVIVNMRELVLSIFVAMVNSKYGCMNIMYRLLYVLMYRVEDESTVPEYVVYFIQEYVSQRHAKASLNVYLILCVTASLYRHHKKQRLHEAQNKR